MGLNLSCQTDLNLNNTRDVSHQKCGMYHIYCTRLYFLKTEHERAPEWSKCYLYCTDNASRSAKQGNVEVSVRELVQNYVSHEIL